MWRGRVMSAIRGKRGQKMLIELRSALDAMPQKRLVSRALQRKDGDCCAIGAVCASRNIDYTEHEDDDEYDLQELNSEIAGSLDVAECLVQEIEYENDEGAYDETPEQRWTRMRAWCDKHIEDTPNAK